MSRKVWVKLPGERDEAAMGFLIAEMSTVGDVLDACKGLFRTPKRSAPPSSNVAVASEPILGLRTKSGLTLQRTMFATQYCGTTLELIEMPVVRNKARTTALGSTSVVAGAAPPEVLYVSLPHRRVDDAEAVREDGRLLRNHRRTQYVSATTAFKLTQDRVLPPTSFTLRFKSGQRQSHLVDKHRKEWETYQHGLDAQQSRAHVTDGKRSSSSGGPSIRRAASPSQHSPMREPSPLTLHSTATIERGVSRVDDPAHDGSGNKFCRTDAAVLRTSTPVASVSLSHGQAAAGSRSAQDEGVSLNWRSVTGILAKPEPQRYRRPSGTDSGTGSHTAPSSPSPPPSSVNATSSSVLEALWLRLRVQAQDTRDIGKASAAASSHPWVVQILNDVQSRVAAQRSATTGESANVPNVPSGAVSSEENTIAIVGEESNTRTALEAEECGAWTALAISAAENHAAANAAFVCRLAEEAAARHAQQRGQFLQCEQKARGAVEASESAEVADILSASLEDRFALLRAALVAEEATLRSTTSDHATDQLCVAYSIANREWDAMMLRTACLQLETEARQEVERTQSIDADALQDAFTVSATSAKNAVEERQARDRLKRVAVVANALADSEVISRRRVAVEENMSRAELVEAAASEAKAAHRAGLQRQSLDRAEATEREAIGADASRILGELGQSAAVDCSARIAWRQQLVSECDAAVTALQRLESELRRNLEAQECNAFSAAVEDFRFFANRVAGNSDRDLAPTRGRTRSVIEELAQEAAELHQQALQQLSSTSQGQRDDGGDAVEVSEAETPTQSSVLQSGRTAEESNVAGLELQHAIHMAQRVEHLFEDERGARNDVVVASDHSHDAIKMRELQEYRNVCQLLSDRAQQHALLQEERNLRLLVLEASEAADRVAVEAKFELSLCEASELCARRQAEVDWCDPLEAWAEELQLALPSHAAKSSTSGTSDTLFISEDDRNRPMPSAPTSDASLRTAPLSVNPLTTQPLTRSSTQHYLSTNIEQRLQEALERKASDEAHEQQRRRRAQTTVGPRPKPTNDSYFSEF